MFCGDLKGEENFKKGIYVYTYICLTYFAVQQEPP